MNETRFIPPRVGLTILGLQLLLLGFRLGSVPLLGPDEPRYARVAVEMARANEFASPTLAGEPWLEKPPLYYWLAGLGFRLLGENEFAARWPAVGAALLLTGVSGAVAARFFGARIGVLAMVILATSPLTFAYGRAATMDMLVAAFATAAAGLLALSITGIAGRSAVPAAWIAMGLAVLAKGPIGFLLPLGTAVLLALLLRRFEIRRIVTPLAVLLFVLVAGPWHLAVYAEQGFHFIEVFFLNHNLQRFSSTIHNHPGPVYYYVPVLLAGVLPWAALVFPAIPGTASIDRTGRAVLIAWFAVPFALFSAAGSKLPGYILPALPAFAIFLALAASGSEVLERRGAWRAAGIFGIVVAALSLALVLRGARDGEPWGRSAIPPALWLVVGALLASRAMQRGERDSLRTLSIVAPGFLLLLTLVAPPVLEALESGRRLFLPANGREVLVVGAWRTAWMSGYFYNDGRVKEVDSVAQVLAVSEGQPRLVLLGRSEWLEAQRMGGIRLLKLAEGPRGVVLAKIESQPTP